MESETKAVGDDIAKSSRPELVRSKYLDPKFLQRAPSYQTITEYKINESEEKQTEKVDVPITHDCDVDNSNISVSQSNGVDISEYGRCIECVKAIPVFSPNGISPGDHVILSGAVYDHHGIIISKSDDGETFQIIEASNTFSGVVIGLSKLFGGKAKIQSSSKKFDFEREKICVVEYRNRRYSKNETIRRAIDILSGLEESVKYKYDLFYNNCEHFATYCVTGQNFSVQVTKFRLTWKLFWNKGFFGISDELARNEKEFEHKIICSDCHTMNKQLLGVRVKPIVMESDVEKGDIIRYSYWNLWHEAVVLEKTKTSKNSVACSIAHYTFCGIFSHRTIKEEKFVIWLDGRCSKLEYAWPQYNVHDPEEVVNRARKRLGEQLFVFFSNDSSHFARWCKLKLQRS